jgi:cytochrome c-type biogenesis protein CcmH
VLPRRSVLAWPVLALPLAANPAQGDPRLEGLFQRFIAPCCWRENLLTHQSPIADELRARIRQLVAEGKSDREIQTVLTEQYTTRILALPEGAKGQWLHWTPVAAGFAGLSILGLIIQRSLRLHAGSAAMQETQAANTNNQPPAVDDPDDGLWDE